MNPVLILTHNNVHLVQRCVESLRRQDAIPAVYFNDNGSAKDTTDWLSKHSNEMDGVFWDNNRGVSVGWNAGLEFLLGDLHPDRAEHCLVVGTDTILPPWFYSELLSYDVPFVTGIAVDSMDAIKEPAQKMPLQPTPDFSAFLIRRDCWETVGPFDERMKLYASDCDFHVRAHRLGIPLWKANVPFYHERSSTLNLACPEERAQIEAQANADREVFRSIYNCLPGTKEYEELFK